MARPRGPARLVSAVGGALGSAYVGARAAGGQVARLPGRVTGGWEGDPLWGAFYDWTVEHPGVGGPLWRLGLGTDQQLLFTAAEEVGHLPDGARVLDVPCGGGVALRSLRADQQVEVVAVDIAEVMLERTRRAAHDRKVDHLVTTVAADVADLPFDDASFDLVVSLMGLHCFPDPAAAVAELARVLRPGGVLSASLLLRGTVPALSPAWQVGRASGLLGPGCSSVELRSWLARGGVQDVTLQVSGAVAYVRGVRRRP
ncbi:class I SAM-dependent methyltransferase [Nocardioides kribbensis]|uniref:class I SAM-dependent methyltransferase n=1 Tax=Nocardioides kribbensis TaxID=305517 RepID=UPI001879AF11|nr:class I SAM-dependent methyltransferase [Nocardioides kribbensis]